MELVTAHASEIVARLADWQSDRICSDSRVRRFEHLQSHSYSFSRLSRVGRARVLAGISTGAK